MKKFIFIPVLICTLLYGCTKEPKEELVLATFGDTWVGDSAISTSQYGLDAYAEVSEGISNNSIMILIMLANIPKEQGWILMLDIKALKDTFILIFNDKTINELGVFGGGFLSKNVSLTEKGAIKYTVDFPNSLTTITPDKIKANEKSYIKCLLDNGLNVNSKLRVDFELYSESGQKIKGTLTGILKSLETSHSEFGSCGEACSYIKTIYTSNRN
jgi:hypothetical protein